MTEVKSVYVQCPRCSELALQKSNEYPIVCCNTPGLTFGTGKCSRCNCEIPVNPEQFDLCLSCHLFTTIIK
jgi:hypothetical protein